MSSYAYLLSLYALVEATIDVTPDNNGESKMSLKAVSTVQGYVSSLRNYYKTRNHIWPPDLSQALNEIVAGHKRDVARLKKSGHMKLQEGKERISIDGYKRVCNKFYIMKPTSLGTKKGFKREWRSGIFAWCYNTLMWNLMSRSISVAEIMLTHLKWTGDCLKVAWPMHKGDQEGKDSFDRSVYCNPTFPGKVIICCSYVILCYTYVMLCYDVDICCILALSVYVFTRSSRTAGVENNTLFEGDKVDDRFNTLLSVVVNEFTDSERMEVGVSPSDTSSHSLRKGAASYCASMIDGPNPVMIFLRAGWTLGDTKDRYLFQGKMS